MAADALVRIYSGFMLKRKDSEVSGGALTGGLYVGGLELLSRLSMEHDVKVLEAFALLKQASHMDLLREDARSPDAQGLSRSRRGGCGLLATAPSGRSPGEGSCPGGGREGGEGCGWGGKREGREPESGFPRGSLGVGRPQALRVSCGSAHCSKTGALGAARHPGQCWLCTPDANAWEKKRPGPSGIRSKSRGEYAGGVVCGGCGAHDARGTVARDEVESDVSLKEGELRNSGSEVEWW
ncbi:hypothetical protein NDU88_004284 [Pleurodeles waltl]|uniref:Uncharacterized protein n=1 Tax=Pleurodeles waltl TaxID=8319 RepID=A0AAV7M5X3_PLEWA|nr:hypothetical protein NDU88_004284 [Pleurodeles waltl]